MSKVVQAGDIAEYVGPHKRLSGVRLEVCDRTRTGKRVYAVMHLQGGAYKTLLIKPENLKRLGGG